MLISGHDDANLLNLGDGLLLPAVPPTFIDCLACFDVLSNVVMRVAVGQTSCAPSPSPIPSIHAGSSSLNYTTPSPHSSC